MELVVNQIRDISMHVSAAIFMNHGNLCMFYRMFQLYSLELAVVTVFGQVPEFLKGESTELMRAIETLAAVSHRKFLYLHHPVIELFVESESPYTILKALHTLDLLSFCVMLFTSF